MNSTIRKFSRTPTQKMRLGALLLLSTATIALMAAPAYANPAGGAVTTGSASISTSTNKTSVDQKSEDVVIDWSSFNVGSGQTTQFVQPNASALAVNRIGGANASQILGTLDANGRIVLINGNGLIIGKGAQGNVGSLIATSTDDSDSDLLAGKFTQAGKQNASVVNNGTITAASGGVVALVAPNVTNTGTINAKLGTVALGAANKFTVDFAGDGLVSFAAQGDVNARASAINSGLLSGANVSMTAHAANGIATGVVAMSGVITAQGVRNVGGTIYLDSGNGTLTTTGTLNAAGATGGGRIETSGQTANISGHITAGQGGQWKVDPEDLTIESNAATTIDGALNAGTSVEEQTTSGAASGSGNQTAGAGDITVASALSWDTSATLTLDAYNSLNILAPISITGAGKLALEYNDDNTGGTLNFGLTPTGFTGNVAFTDVVGSTTQGALTINGNSYTIANSVSQLASDISSNAGGDFALANSYNASGDGTYSSSPISTPFTGTFEGLGNTISNLTVNDGSNDFVGLFGTSEGTIRNVGVVGGSVSGDAQVGGLVGYNLGTIISSFSTVSVNGTTDVGGLVGENFGAASGGGVITDSWAAGEVSSTPDNSSDIGGLVGLNDGISTSYLGTITGSYATGLVNPGADSLDIGGLVGRATVDGQIADSYATGAVEAPGGSDVGGLAGRTGGAISGSYSTGLVQASGSDVGGFVGYDYNPGDITNSYWDMSTSGIGATQGAGSVSNDSGITGETTSGLQGALPSGFSSSVWGTGAGLYPYLLRQYPSGTPQSISGIAYTDAGVTPDVYDTVSALANGDTLTSGASVGANGYYYILLAPGTLSNSQVLTTSSYGAALAENVSGSVSGMNLYINTLNNVTSAALYSTAQSGEAADLATAEGGNSAAQTFVSELGNYQVTSSAANFKVDEAIDLSGTNVEVADPAGNITVSAAQSWSNANTLTLNAGGSLTIDAPISVNGAGGVVLDAGYDTTTVPGNSLLELSFGNGDNIAYATGTGEGISGQSLAINGTPYTLVYSTTDLQNINSNLNGNYALANALDASSVTNWTPLGVDSSGNIQNSGNGFNGAFEGLGNTISNFTLDLPGVLYVGLFGYTGSTSTIRDLALAGGSVTATGFAYVGALVGQDEGVVDNVPSNLAVNGANGSVGGLVGELDGTIVSSSATGSVSGGLYVDAGGLVGYAGGEIANSYAIGNITAGDQSAAGGLAGYSGTAVVSSYATGSVTAGASADAGGLVGDSYGEIENSHATGNVNATASAYIGGLAGYANDVENSYATGNVVATTDAYAGGLSGYDNGSITGSYATGTVGAGSEADAGGLAGFANQGVGNSYATGAVTAADESYVGGLIGFNVGPISNSYATGQATSTGAYSQIGGLAGYSGGDITQSYATGSASGSGTDTYVGGLVGANGGSIEEAYATGAVGGTGATAVGGLVGETGYGGTIAQAYATGYVAPGSAANVGGLVGVDYGSAGQITSSYWDTGTSGIANLSQGAGNIANDSGIAGKTTANLQSALPAGFDNTVWGTGPGLYPYLLWQFPSGTPQAISGTVFSGSTEATGENVGLLVNGSSVMPAITAGSGANGYYYLLLAPGTISGAGSDIVTYLTSGTPANTFVQSATGSLAGDDLFENTFVAASSASNSAAILAGLPAALGSASGPQFLYTAASGVVAGVNLVVYDTAASFTLDSTLDVGDAILTLYTTGSDTQTAGTITANQLISISTGGLSLGQANAISDLGPVGNSGTGGIAVTDAQALALAGNLNAGTGAVTLTTTGAGNGIALDAHLTGGTVDLVSAGTIRENGTNGFIHASVLEGSSDGYAFFNEANKIGALGDFTTAGAGAFSLYDWETLDVTDTLETGKHSITLDTQIGDLDIDGSLSGGTVSLTSVAGEVAGAGDIDANVLNVTADSGIDLTGDNDIHTIGADTTNSGPNTINDEH